ncbi:hypothetical protein BDN67DRAFT_959157 [Paxillus ammoniavirescens]|nr:hypothetical protein BDN67DRAFT_959157 [Paxillus ammoniavirescens]
MNLHYAPSLYDLADRLADNVGPFLGVHWRMENVPVQNLAWCAASLVSVLHGLLEDNVVGENVRHVWLATDYPYVSLAEASGAGFILDKIGDGDENDARRERSLARHGAQKSSTFKVLTPEHDDAIAVLREAFQPGGDLDAWKLSDLSEQLRRYPYVEGRINIDEELLDDSGVRGILDKLVVVRSQVFVGGSKDCSKVSSFSKQVVEARQILFDKDKNGADIRNVIEYFGEW